MQPTEPKHPFAEIVEEGRASTRIGQPVSRSWIPEDVGYIRHCQGGPLLGCQQVRIRRCGGLKPGKQVIPSSAVTAVDCALKGEMSARRGLVTDGDQRKVEIADLYWRECGQSGIFAILGDIACRQPARKPFTGKLVNDYGSWLTSVWFIDHVAAELRQWLRATADLRVWASRAESSRPWTEWIGMLFCGVHPRDGFARTTGGDR